MLQTYRTPRIGLFYPGIMKQGLGLKGLGWTVLVTFTHIRYEQYGLSYLDLWTLPALWSRSGAQRIRMAFSNIDREGIKGMKGNRNVHV